MTMACQCPPAGDHQEHTHTQVGSIPPCGDGAGEPSGEPSGQLSKSVERTYFRIGTLGNLGEDLRNQSFTLDWVFSEARDNSKIGCLNKYYLSDGQTGAGLRLYLVKQQQSHQQREEDV